MLPKVEVSQPVTLLPLAGNAVPFRPLRESDPLRVPIRMTRGRDTVDCGAGQGARATTAQKVGRRARATPACDARRGVPLGCDENGRLPRQDSSPHHVSGAASSPFLAFNPFWSQRGSRGILIGTLIL